MNIMICNPAFPGDKSKGKALSNSQFEILHDDIIEMMNESLHTRIEIAAFEAKMLQKLEDAGDPLIFDEKNS